MIKIKALMGFCRFNRFVRQENIPGLSNEYASIRNCDLPRFSPGQLSYILLE